MSPHGLESRLHVSRVAVIGAGASGLAAAKYLLAEKKFSEVRIFDQRDTIGGTWAYSPLSVIDNDFTVPRTSPSKRPDTAIRTDDSASPQFVSPVYDFLETNIPHSLMNYTDLEFAQGSSLFPEHAVVKRYLEEYGKGLTPHLSLSTQILGVSKTDKDGGSVWEVETLDLKTEEMKRSEFDAVMVASGHYNDPFIPEIKGLAEYNAAHPGAISHSKFYRNQLQFEGKKVVIVGNSASGIDLSAQIATVCQHPVLVSVKTELKTAEDEAEGAILKLVPEITEFVPETRSVRFANGEVESDIDSVVFCTGYFYSFPFLRALSPPVITDGSYARNLYEHMLYIDDPTLAFVGIPQRIVPFPIAEAQTAWVARLWAGRLAVPPTEEMRAWEAQALAEAGGGGKAIHTMLFPKDVDYLNKLHEQSLSAATVEGLENDGKGKLPPYWGPEKRWTRERVPLIKVASRLQGERRHEIKTLAELGFDFEASQKRQENDFA
ncbi:hypothetical protein VD0002_g6473 [Verticillium dahliae]|uniref:Thiol-specific monooxygenase n=2 Tax=Verticillium dahliae TaxID=27337 RepID=G2X0T2_VERDV|nr:thiol-specific monooxygenase [Verticillium dahliae VdLs.17]KAF3343919.1 hypothetical protein VdG2_07977 [Verticillium dahliae VDG2]KAH6704837.1 thiol-specific monooxygenase [Verticillium dahliae]EGY22423.1 thiol-specific monooxygenase [Verticillium dahliae VdLs.17]PNH31836.1 hypothetical protein BJF96_g5106 [Verticillium dahliae]PNH49110.1 hypothetical protein VD0003_g8017 [Verticillium dahliae]